MIKVDVHFQVSDKPPNYYELILIMPVFAEKNFNEECCDNGYCIINNSMFTF